MLVQLLRVRNSIRLKKVNSIVTKILVAMHADCVHAQAGLSLCCSRAT